MNDIALVTNPQLTDYAESPYRHPNPRLIEAGQSIDLGRTDPSAYLLEAVANYKRLSFTPSDDERGAVHATISQIRPTHSNRIHVIVRLVPTSGIQLKQPNRSCALITVDLHTGTTVLTCNLTGTARVAKVRLEPSYMETGGQLVPSGDSYWVAYVEFQGKTDRWSSADKHDFEVGDLVRVRVTDAGYLVLA